MKSAPPILSISQCEFNSARSCAHARKTIPLTPIHLFTKQMVPSLCPELLTQSLLRSFSPVLCVHLTYIRLPSINNIFMHVSFILVSFIFITHFFRGLAGACVNPGIFLNSLFVHSLLCQITHSFLSQTCVSTFPMHALSTILLYSAKL